MRFHTARHLRSCAAAADSHCAGWRLDSLESDSSNKRLSKVIGGSKISLLSFSRFWFGARVERIRRKYVSSQESDQNLFLDCDSAAFRGKRGKNRGGGDTPCSGGTCCGMRGRGRVASRCREDECLQQGRVGLRNPPARLKSQNVVGVFSGQSGRPGARAA